VFTRTSALHSASSWKWHFHVRKPITLLGPYGPRKGTPSRLLSVYNATPSDPSRPAPYCGSLDSQQYLCYGASLLPGFEIRPG
jgi:hypothetical protein